MSALAQEEPLLKLKGVGGGFSFKEVFAWRMTRGRDGGRRETGTGD